MPILKPNEYDISYFDGLKAREQNLPEHPAGYSRYDRWYRKEGENSLGEFWKDLAAKYRAKFNLSSKKILELGCAKGFVVEDLRSMGVDAYGLDISPYAIDEAVSGIKPFLRVADVRTDLDTYTNKEFDLVFSLGLLECLTDAEITKLGKDCKRISKKVVFIVWETAPSQYYNVKTLQDWESLFPKNIILISKESSQEVVV